MCHPYSPVSPRHETLHVNHSSNVPSRIIGVLVLVDYYTVWHARVLEWQDATHRSSMLPLSSHQSLTLLIPVPEEANS